MNKVEDIRQIFKNKLKNEEFVIDKNGGKVIEIVGASFIADEDSIIGIPNIEYIEKEIEWYNSTSRNVYDIKGVVPKIWQMVSDKDGNVNSNYGWCIYSKENGEQYKNAIRKLKQDKLSRQAIMIYTRGNLHTEYNTNGMADFMCCQTVQYVIRNNKLSCVVNFRSNDSRFGYLNDYAWIKHVLLKMHNELCQTYKELEIGDIIWNAGSLHVYERDFSLV